MQKLIVVTFILANILLCKNTYAQNWQWGRGNTGGGMDGWAVATDAAGNSFTGGITLSNTTAYFGIIAIPFSSISSGGYQTIVTKYDPAGNVLWAKGTKNGNAWLINIATDPSGNLIVFGNFTSPILEIGNFTLTNSINPETKYFLAKYDPNGNVLWAKCDGNTQFYMASLSGLCGAISTGALATDANGNIYITANFHLSTISIGSNTLTNNSTGTADDIFIAKYDPNGNVIWTKSYGGNNADDAYGLCVTPAGDIYIAGIFNSASLTFGTTVLTNTGTNQISFIARLNSTGVPIWASTSNAYIANYAIGIAADLNNNVYMTGGFTDASLSFSGTTITNPYSPNTAMYVVKFDAGNNVSWSKTIGYTRFGSRATGYCIAMAQCGNVWVSGAFYDTILIDGHLLLPPSNNTADPVFITGFTSSGTYINSSALSSGGDDQNGIACDPQGNVFMCSDYQSYLPFNIGKDTLWTGSSGELLYLGKFGNTSTELQHSVITLCKEGITNLSPQGKYTNYIWSDGKQGNSHPMIDSGTIFVFGFDSCAVGVVDTFIISNKCDCSKNLFIPNTFTPNGDGENDVFYPRANIDIQKITSFKIFNRWGTLIFDRTNIAPNDVFNAWDGTYKDQLQRPEVFVWTVDAVCSNGQIINKKGSVTVIR